MFQVKGILALILFGFSFSARADDVANAARFGRTAIELFNLVMPLLTEQADRGLHQEALRHTALVERLYAAKTSINYYSSLCSTQSSSSRHDALRMITELENELMAHGNTLMGVVRDINSAVNALEMGRNFILYGNVKRLSVPLEAIQHYQSAIANIENAQRLTRAAITTVANTHRELVSLELRLLALESLIREMNSCSIEYKAREPDEPLIYSPYHNIEQSSEPVVESSMYYYDDSQVSSQHSGTYGI